MPISHSSSKRDPLAVIVGFAQALVQRFADGKIRLKIDKHARIPHARQTQEACAPPPAAT